MSLRQNSLKRLESEVFDVAIIGGGVNGLSAAWDASLRGLSVVVLEKSDFGSETSQGCFKIVHGGLRYLQHANLTRLYESVEEQRIFRKIAPHLVHPLPFMVPCYGKGAKGKLALTLGLSVYELLTYGRNRGVDSSKALSSFKTLNKSECLEIAPLLNPEGLSGGVVFYDAQMSNCERMTLSFGLSARSKGACLCNYLEVEGFESHLGEIRSLEARDLLEGGVYQVKAKSFVNAAGPWVSRVLNSASSLDREEETVFSKGLQVVVPQVCPKYAVALESPYKDAGAYVSRGGRSYFMVPWRGHTLVGTADIVHEGCPDKWSFDKKEVEEFLAEVYAMYPHENLKVNKVKHVFGGLRKVDAQVAKSYLERGVADESEVAVSKSDRVVDQTDVCKNLVSIVGVKYTTTRLMAEKAVDMICSKLSIGKPCLTRETPLLGAESSVNDSSLDSDYGAISHEVLAISAESEEFADRLSSETEVLGAEVVNAVRNEQASNLSDIVFRRTTLGSFGNPGEEALAQAARIAAKELGWSSQETREQLERVTKDFFEK